MKAKLIMAVSAAVMVFAISLTFAQLANSSWPMFHQNPQHTGLSPYAGPSIPSLAWSYQGDRMSSSPAIGSDGKVYISSFDDDSFDGYLYSLNPTASLDWSYKTGDGMVSSPAIGSDGKVYVGSEDYCLYSINSSGTFGWSYQTRDVIESSSPAIDSDGKVYIISGDSSLYSINSNGGLVWSYQSGYYIGSSSPAIGSDGKVYFGSDAQEQNDGYLYSINSSGSLAWSYQNGSDEGSSPAIGSDGKVYIGSSKSETIDGYSYYYGYLYSVNSNASLVWSYQSGGDIFSSPAIGSDGKVYVGDTRLYSINSSGSLVWSYQSGGDIFSSPAIGSDGKVYIGSSKTESIDESYYYYGYLYSINSNASLDWSYRAANWVGSSPAIGSDGKVYFGSDDTHLYSIQQASPPILFVPFNIRLGHAVQPPTGVLSIFVDVTVKDTSYAGVPCLPYIAASAGGKLYYIVRGNKLSTKMTPYLTNGKGKKKYFTLYENIFNYDAATIPFSGLAPGRYWIYGALLNKKGAPMGPIAERVLTIE